MMMSWLFNGQPLQWGRRETTFRRRDEPVKERWRPMKVEGKYRANAATRFSVKGSGAAKLTRFTFGQCYSWPKNRNCIEAREWVRTRSKLEEFKGGAGIF